MGAVRNTTQNLEVVAVDDEEGVVLICGAVPGPKNGWVLISDAIKAKPFDGVPFPAGLLSDAPAAPAEAEEVAPVADAPAEADVSAQDAAPAEDTAVEAPAESSADAEAEKE